MTEKILDVYIHATGGHIDCMCLKENPCFSQDSKGCEPDKVRYDQYRGWEDCMKQNIYGK